MTDDSLYSDDMCNTLLVKIGKMAVFISEPLSFRYPLYPQSGQRFSQLSLLFQHDTTHGYQCHTSITIQQESMKKTNHSILARHYEAVDLQQLACKSLYFLTLYCNTLTMISSDIIHWTTPIICSSYFSTAKAFVYLWILYQGESVMAYNNHDNFLT